MDINNIKPPGGPDPYASPEDQPVDGKRDSRFSEAARGHLEASDPVQSTGTSLNVVTQYGKAALDDPAKLDSMVRDSVSELIDSSANITGPLSGPEKQSLIDFLSTDPMLRKQVESYLRKVLV